MNLPEDNEATIRLSQSSEMDTRDLQKPHRSKRTKKKEGQRLRPDLIGYSVVVIACLGWGLSTYLGRFSAPDEIDSVAEIDGFESAEPFLGPPVGQTESPPASTAAAELLPAPSFDELAPPAKSAEIEVSTITAKRATDVWLTGTIEDTDTATKHLYQQGFPGGQAISQLCDNAFAGQIEIG